MALSCAGLILFYVQYHLSVNMQFVSFFLFQ
jgi:hypothetical protein